MHVLRVPELRKSFLKRFLRNIWMQMLVLMVLVWVWIPPTSCEEPAHGQLPLQPVGDSSGDHFLPTDWRACRGQLASVWCLQELSEKLCGRNRAPHVFLQCWRDLLHYVFFQYLCLHLGIVVLKKGHWLSDLDWKTWDERFLYIIQTSCGLSLKQRKYFSNWTQNVRVWSLIIFRQKKQR